MNTLAVLRTQQSSSSRFDYWLLASWLLTLARLPLLAGALSIIFGGGDPSLLIAVVLAIVVADIMDGRAYERSIAFARGSSGALRHTIDAIGDRFVMYSIVAASVFTYDISPLVYSAIAARELILDVVVIAPLLKDKLVLKANTWSKTGTLLIALTGINAVTDLIPDAIIIVPMIITSSIGIYLYLLKPRYYPA